MSLKRKQKREMKAGGMRDVTMGEPVENEITEEAIAKMSQRALRVVRIQQDGSVSGRWNRLEFRRLIPER
jgi:hypothetical protein